MRRNICLILVAVGLGFFNQKLVAQYCFSDSLVQIIQKKPNEASSIGVLFQLSRTFQEKDAEASLRYAQEMLKLAEDYDRSKDQLRALNCIGSAQNVLSNNKAALDAYHKGYLLADETGDDAFKGGFADNKGIIYKKMVNYPKSVESHLEALDIYNEIGNDSSKVLVYNNLGVVYRHMKNDSLAIKYYLKGIEYGEKFKHYKGLIGCYNNVANVYLHFQNNDSLACVYHQKALEIANSIDDEFRKAHCLISLGNVYGEKGNLEKAEIYFRLALEAFERLKFSFGVSVSYCNLARVLFKKGDRSQKALGYAEKAFDMAMKNEDVRTLHNSLDIKAEILESRGEYADALTIFRQATLYKDSVINDKNKSEIANLQTRYNSKEQNSEIELLRLEKEAFRSRLLIAVLLLVLVVVIGGFLFFLLRFKQAKKKANLERQNIRVASQLDDSNNRTHLLQTELDNTSKKLANYTLGIMRRKQLFESILTCIEQVVEGKKVVHTELLQMKHAIRQVIDDDGDWEDFEMYFDNVHNRFFDSLKIKFPQLTPNELRLCALVKLQLSVKEIADIQGISPNSVKVARYRLRKKLNLSADENLSDFMSSLIINSSN